MIDTSIKVGVNAAGHVVVTVPVPRPWWQVWRARVWWFVVTPGQARTMAVALRQAAELIDRAKRRA